MIRGRTACDFEPAMIALLFSLQNLKFLKSVYVAYDTRPTSAKAKMYGMHCLYPEMVKHVDIRKRVCSLIWVPWSACIVAVHVRALWVFCPPQLMLFRICLNVSGDVSVFTAVRFQGIVLGHRGFLLNPERPGSVVPSFVMWCIAVVVHCFLQPLPLQYATINCNLLHN